MPAAWPAYDLTTFHQPVGAMVEATVRLLVSRIEGRVGPAQRVVVPGELLVRGSARLPAEGVVMIEGRRVWRPVAAVGGRRR